jgi:hypothetical protein
MKYNTQTTQKPNRPAGTAFAIYSTMTTQKTNARMEIRLKVWIEDGKIAVEFTDAKGQKTKSLFNPDHTTIELWSSTAYGKLYIQDKNKLIVSDVITSEKIEETI